MCIRDSNQVVLISDSIRKIRPALADTFQLMGIASAEARTAVFQGQLRGSHIDFLSLTGVINLYEVKLLHQLFVTLFGIFPLSFAGGHRAQIFFPIGMGLSLIHI